MLGQPLPAGSAGETHHRLSERGEDVLVLGPEVFGAILRKQQGTQFFASCPSAESGFCLTASTANSCASVGFFREPPRDASASRCAKISSPLPSSCTRRA